MKVYLDLMRKVIDNGNYRMDRTGTGTYAIFGEQIKHNMKDGFPLLTSKRMATKQIITELIWFMNGETNIKPLLKAKNYIWSGDGSTRYNGHHHKSLSINEYNEKVLNDEISGDLGPIYGKQWRDWNGIDQLSEVIDGLINNPFGRRHIINSWNVSELNRMVLPPCHYSIQFFVKETKEGKELSLMWNQRSCDLALGIPFNIASYGILLHIIAKLTNMKVGELIGSLGDVHLYSDHIEQAKEQIKLDTYDLCTIEFDESLDFTNLDTLLETLTYENYKSIKFVNYKSNPRIKYKLSN